MSAMDNVSGRLRAEAEKRNAVDFIENLVEKFDGHFGSWLVSRQMEKDHKCGCPECGEPDDDFPESLEN